MNSWATGSAWFAPTLGIDQVAEFLDIQPASVRRYLTDHAGFPEPAELRGNRNYWTRAALYRHAWDVKPQRRQLIPRLCPLTDDPAPAQFVESEVVYHRGATYVVHTWEPGDGRGPVGVAYPKDFQRGDDSAARQLLPLHPHLSAIALPKGHAGLLSPRQPQIAVADRAAGTDWYPSPTGWLDLIALMHVDLPWWSHGLTDVEAMNAWRPGTPIAKIRPHAADFTAAHFDRCRPHDGSPADRALAAVAAATDRILAAAFGISPDGHDDFPNRPGLQHAAVAALSSEPPATLSPEIISDALHHHINDGALAVRAIETARWFEVLHPAITHELLVIDPARCSGLAQEWCQRLVTADPADSIEIGYHWVAHAMTPQPYQWWRDPLNPTLWAITAADGTLYANLGTRMPAQGRVEELAIEDHHPFFRDSAGNTFPVPSATGRTHNTTGSAATRLTIAILALMDDASRDIHHADCDYDLHDARTTGLYENVCNTTNNNTAVLTRPDLEELREMPNAADRHEDILAPTPPLTPAHVSNGTCTPTRRGESNVVVRQRLSSTRS